MNKNYICGVPDEIVEWLGLKDHMIQEVVITYSNKEFASVKVSAVVGDAPVLHKFLMSCKVEEPCPSHSG